MLILAAALGLAAAPPVDWQARLLDTSGEPIQGDHPVQWSLFDAPVDGNLVWTESATLAFDGGYGAMTLGVDANNLIPSDGLDGTALYIQVSVDGVALGARERVGGVLQAGMADALAHPGYVYGSIAEAAADGLLTYVDMDSPNGCEGASIADRMSYLSAVCIGTGTRSAGAVGMSIDRGTGVQHGVLLTYPNSDSYSTFTASMWWKPTSLTIHASGDGAGILWLSDDPGDSVVGLFDHTGPDRLTWGDWPNSGNFSNGSLHATDLQLRSNADWYNIVVTRDAGSDVARMYVNGVLLDEWAGKALQLGPKGALANYHWLTGGNSNAHYGRGYVDDFAAWNRALSPAEVAGLYAQQRSGRQVTP